MSTNELFLNYKINYISLVPRFLITLAYLLPDQAAPVLVPTVQEKFSEGKIANVAKVKRKGDISLKMLIDPI